MSNGFIRLCSMVFCWAAISACHALLSSHMTNKDDDDDDGKDWWNRNRLVQEWKCAANDQRWVATCQLTEQDRTMAWLHGTRLTGSNLGVDYWQKTRPASKAVTCKHSLSSAFRTILSSIARTRCVDAVYTVTDVARRVSGGLCVCLTQTLAM